MLRPTFLSFETARKTIVAAQYGLDTVGHNMANEHTEGYTRQRVDQVSFALNPLARYSLYGQQLPGQGTLVTGINRVRDPYLDNRYRLEATEFGELGVKAQGLQQINNVFDEIEKTGLHDKFDSLIDAFAKLETDFSSSGFKLNVRTEAEQMADMIRKYATDLNRVEARQASDFEAEVQGMSEILEQIAFYNDKIAEQHLYGNPANEMMDERDMLLDELALRTDITVTYESVIVSEERSIDKLVVKMNGLDSPINLVDGDKFAQFELVEGKTDPYTVQFTDPNGFVREDANKLFEKGAIKGYLDIMNGKGTFAQQNTDDNTARGIPYFRESYDQFAQKFADTMNWINAGSPVDDSVDPPLQLIPDPTAPANLFTYSPLKPAETLTITQEWRDNLDHLMTHTAEDDLDPDNPKYVLKFKEALMASYEIANGEVDGLPTTIKGSFQEFLVSFANQMGTDQKMTDEMHAGSELDLADLMDNRDAVSAVSANEESINMMTYQNYYNAALRYMTTLDEALNQIITQMGLVGR